MKVIVIGATGTIGSAVVKVLSPHHEVVKVGHSHGELTCDIGSEESIVQLFERVKDFDAVVVATGKVLFEPMEKMTAEKYFVGLSSKLMGQVNVVRMGSRFVRDGGSFTLTSGILNIEPIYQGTSAAMVNGALEGFVKAAAMELTRGVRVNLVSPTVLQEAMPQLGSFFPGFVPVSGEEVGMAYWKCVEGKMTGRILRVGY